MHNIWRCLRTGLFLLFFPQGEERDTRNFNNLETDTWNITLGLALTTETGNQDFVVFVNVVQTTIVGDESRNLLSVLDQLNTNTLSNGRVGLLGFDTTR
jgi:hypothetical protein